MKFLRPALLFLVFISAGFAAEPASSAAAASPGEGLPLLRGILLLGNERRFALCAGNSTETTWVLLGGTFEGWQLAEYREKSDSLVVRKDGREAEISLAASTILAASNKATLADAQAVLRKMDFEKMLDRMIVQQRKAVVESMRQMIAKDPNSKISPEDFAAFQTKVMDVMFAQMKGEELVNDVARIYSDVFTRDELQGLMDFYGTPSGQAMMEKQPEVQKRMMEVIMPRMMSAMPQVQELGRQFAEEQKAKQAARTAVPPPASATHDGTPP